MRKIAEKIRNFLEKILVFEDKKGKFIFLIIFLIFISLVVFRRPDSITNAQFYAEDGFFWYSEAYNNDSLLKPFLDPKQGYFQTISRLGGLFSLLVDIRYAPLLMNILAIVIQILPALFFLSKRFDRIVPKISNRFFISLIYLLLPATFETHANLTNAMWRLALLAFLIIIAAPSRKIWQKIADSIVLFISGLSGPFVFFLFPIWIIKGKFTSYKQIIYQIFALGLAFVIQAYAYVATRWGFYTVDVRSEAPLGVGIITFFKLFVGKIFIAGIFGLNSYQKIAKWDLWESGFLPIIFGVGLLFILGYVFRKASLELKLFLFFGSLIFIAGLMTPQVSLSDPQWDTMLNPRAGNRYFLIPIVALFVSIAWLAFECKNKFLKKIGLVLFLSLILIGIPKDWRFSKFKDYHFNSQVIEFKNVSSGESYPFKIYPGWVMTLKKK